MALDVIFSFDTTGSMYPCLGQVRQRVEQAFTPLYKDIPDVRVGICAHGDYCDAGSTYVTKWSPLSSNIHDPTQFVRTVGSTGGGDADECYELVLHEAQQQNWRKEAKKVFVMIGDCNPHKPNYPLNKKNLNWADEVTKLHCMGVSVYSVQALSRPGSTAFYGDLAQFGGGYHLTLDQFSDIVEIIKAIAYKEDSEDAFNNYEQHIVENKKMNRALDRVFGTLKQPRDAKGRFVSTRFKEVEGGLIPVPPGRFQKFNVPSDYVIRNFAEDNELIFKAGKGFYEFTKPEEIQEKKEVVLRDRETGDMFSGPQARNMIGIPFGERGKIKPSDIKYQVFIQSTSYNRKLKGGTEFLYEVDMDR